jgi:hypothetical protein
MLRFRAYGLSIDADVPLPGLREGSFGSVADLTIWLHSRPAWLHPALHSEARPWPVPIIDPPAPPNLAAWTRADGAFFHLRYADDTEFVLSRQGDRIWGRWPSSLSLEDTATYLLGPVLGLVLRLRGQVCLHASAVAIEGRAVALVGPAGAGKSTLAAAFARRGCPVISDDLLCLHDEDEAIQVQPGSPWLRLWSDSAAALCGSAADLPLLTPNWDKRYLNALGDGHRFQEEPLDLQAIYVLDYQPRNEGPLLISLPPREALLRLVANTHASRFLDAAGRAREFQTLGRLVQKVPCRVLYRTSCWADLPRVCSAVVEDLRDYVPATSAGRP